MSEREKLVELLQSKRARRLAVMADLKTLDEEIAALESVRNQIDAVRMVRVSGCGIIG